MARTIGTYRIGGMLGKGGMSVVYKVLHPASGEWVALKLFSPHPHLLATLGEARALRLFQHEVATLAAIRHPNVVRVLDRGQHSDGRPFFTMDYHCRNLGMLIGESYRPDMPSRVMNADTVIRNGRKLLLGLSALHNSGIIHRDIKPYNLLLTGEDQLLICDFGLSRVRGESPAIAVGKTRGLVVGSPFYAAPEQERDPTAADARSDLYSVGVVLYRMLTGQLPEEDSPIPSRVQPGIDEAWDRFVSKALKPAPEARFQSADAMLAELDALSEAHEKRKAAVCFDRSIGNHAVSAPGETRRPFPVAARGESARRSDAPACIPRRPRSLPVKVRPADAPAVFHSDTLGRPIEIIANDFASGPFPQGLASPEHPLSEKTRSAGMAPVTVFDRSTGLLWEIAGSLLPLKHDEARDHVSDLNRKAFGGRADWRLPTVNEIFSVLKPSLAEDRHCLPDVFPPDRKWLWTCDLRSFAAAWYVDCESGFAGWGDFSCRFYVRAVSSPDFPAIVTCR